MTINSISCKLIEKKGKSAEIEIDGQKITVPTENLPSGVKVGENFELCFVSHESAQMKENVLARAILEEILNGGK